MSDEKMFIPVVLGTSRPGRRSENVAKYMVSFINNNFGDKVVTELVDVANFDLSVDGKNPEQLNQEFSDLVGRADGFVLVTPEYNHTFAGGLKRLLDLEYDKYEKKPAGLVGVSISQWGGIRAVESLVNYTKALGLVNIKRDMYFARVEDLFDQNGVIQDSSYDGMAGKFLEELVWYAKALKVGRSGL